MATSIRPYLALSRLHSLDSPRWTLSHCQFEEPPPTLHLPTGPPPSLVQGQEPGFSSSVLPPPLPNQPPGSLGKLACLSWVVVGGEQALARVPTLSQLRSPQKQSCSWSRKGHKAGENNKHTVLLQPWPSSIPTTWCRILG